MLRLALFGLFMLATTTFAADPASGRVAKKLAPKNEYRPNIILQAVAEAEYRDRQNTRNILSALSCTSPLTGAYVCSSWDPDPKASRYRMAKLLNESEDLRQARDQWHRFWMNNQPSVLTYERLNGAIGP